MGEAGISYRKMIQSIDIGYAFGEGMFNQMAVFFGIRN